MSEKKEFSTTKEVQERGILFQGDMIRAILEGRKTQTRRVLKSQPPNWANYPVIDQAGYAVFFPVLPFDLYDQRCWPEKQPLKCPYGKLGDRLWVKETYQALRPNTIEPIKKIIPRPGICVMAYKATENERFDLYGGKVYNGPWRSGRFMPRWASRILLEIVNIECKKIYDISEEEAIKEGFIYEYPVTARTVFFSYWDALQKNENKVMANPWVWVIEYQMMAGKAS